MASIEAEVKKLGGTVEAIEPQKRDSDVRIVLANIPGQFQPWVTWCFGPGQHLYWGHYYLGQQEAMDDFLERVTS